jgi:hypothetical protein
MNAVEKAYQTQLNNIQQKTGKNLDELREFVRSSGITKHSQIRELLSREFVLGYGDANTLTHAVLQTGEEIAPDAVLDGIYSGAKAHLRPIHDRFMDAIQELGEFETAPKKSYVSLRRKKQFAMIGPATNTRVEVGLNHKSLGEHPRLVPQKPGSMCSHVIRITDAGEVDDQLIAWVREAFEAAG